VTAGVAPRSALAVSTVIRARLGTVSNGGLTWRALPAIHAMGSGWPGGVIRPADSVTSRLVGASMLSAGLIRCGPKLIEDSMSIRPAAGSGWDHTR